MKQLTHEVIQSRMIEWRNLKKLHKQAQKRIASQNKTIKEQAARIVVLETTAAEQAAVIQTLQLQMAELREMVFGRKKKSIETADDEEEPEHPPHPRMSASYHRPVPHEDEVTETKPHPIDQCARCAAPLTKKTTRVYYEEDIPLMQKRVVQHAVERGWCASCRGAGSQPSPCQLQPLCSETTSDSRSLTSQP